MGIANRTENLKSLLFSVEPFVCAERAALVTEAYQKYEHEPVCVKRAKALNHYLTNMGIYVAPGELIVGNQTGAPGGVPVFPETQASWLSTQLDHISERKFHRLDVSDAVKTQLRSILPFWVGKTPLDRGPGLLPEETQAVYDMSPPVISPNLTIKNSAGHVVPNYEMVIRRGFKHIREDAKNMSAALDITLPESLPAAQFYRAFIIVCDAVMALAQRYAKECHKLSKTEMDPTRASELESMAQICERVPAHPASNFHEAVQSFWFAHLVVMLEGDGLAVSPGRLDQYLYPYYKSDLSKKIINTDDARVLIENLWIKFNQVRQLPDVPPVGQYTAAFTMAQNVIVGGQQSNGKDATNELSYLFLQIERHIRCPQPALSVRLHSRTPEKLIRETVETIRRGGGKPAAFYDDAVIPSLMNNGVTLEDARDYAIVGCVEPTPNGNCFGWTNAAMFNLARCLELSIFRGDQTQSESIEPEKVEVPGTFAKFLDSFKKQVAFYVDHMCVILNTWDRIQSELVPLPFLSTMVDGCLAAGRDVTMGGAKYNFTGPQGAGIANVADSLAAIRTAVFEEQFISFEALKDALKHDFPDERIKQYLINKVPKYGNDDDTVDCFAEEIAAYYCNCIRKNKNPRNGCFRPGLYTVAAHVALGKAVGALPDGRKKSDPLADGVSPAHGRDRNGITALAKSASKIDHILAGNGTNLNPRLHPQLLDDREGRLAFQTFLRALAELKILHAQFNVVTSKELREAQYDPERYKDLLVRVSGYSAFFVDLNTDLQNDIIGRTEHNT